MIELFLLSMLVSITLTVLKKNLTFTWGWSIFSKKVTSTSKTLVIDTVDSSNKIDQNLLSYYSKLKFKSVKELQIFDLQRTLKESIYREDQQVHYKDYEELRQKIARMKKVENDDIQILADFDHTISSREINGKFNVPTLGIFRESSIMPDNFRQKLKDMFNYYYPIEKDVSIPENQKIQLIQQWYDEDNLLTGKQNITKNTIQEVLDSANIGFRNQAHSFFQICKKNKLNLSIVSGGCSDFIATMIQQIINLNDYLRFKIYSNEIVMQDGKLLKYNMKINSVGKKMVISNRKIANRKNIILYGDILADLNMVKNVDYDNLISFGFLNKPRSDKDLGQYLEKFDVVIVNDGSFEVPNQILNEIITA